jgi:SAM-dependent methyltransferase
MNINRLLTDSDRDKYKPTIDLMFKLCPEMMARKISEANVQQAFVFDTFANVFHEDGSSLSIGCFEDTAFASLVEYGYEIVGIDPVINHSLHDYYISNSEKRFNVIFSTSVIEHVENDEQFIDEICKLLAPGGTAILTMDFRNDYTPGMPLPYSDVRFYTENDLRFRLGRIIYANDCEFVGSPNWQGEPDFLYQGHTYSFATMVFKRLD